MVAHYKCPNLLLVLIGKRHISVERSSNVYQHCLLNRWCAPVPLTANNMLPMQGLVRSNLPLNKSPSITFLVHSVVRAIRTFNVHFETRGLLNSCDFFLSLFVSCAQFAKISLNSPPHHALQLDNTVVSICCVPVRRPDVVLLLLRSVHQPSSSTLCIFSDGSSHIPIVGGAPPRCSVHWVPNFGVCCLTQIGPSRS